MAVKEYSDIKKTVDVMKDKEILSGRLIENITVSTTPTEISHGLGRKFRGYILVKSTDNITLYDTVSSFPSRTIILTASNTATISLWVF